MFWAFITNRLFLASAAILFFGWCIALGWQNGVSRRATVAAEAQTEKLNLAITEPRNGYIARIASCQSELAGARISINSQNAAIDQVIRSAAEAKARSEARIKAAEAQTRAAQRRAETIRTFQPQDGETQCEAAFRLHRESIQ